jgi:nucleoside-diphosphate-sugar epimerase
MNKKKERRVFITGANGFLGANLTRRLIKEGYDVHVLLRKDSNIWRLKDIKKYINIHQGDITEFNSLYKILQTLHPNYILHLAVFGAYHYQTDTKKIIHVNVEGTRNLLEASKDIPYTCFINTGSSSEYGIKNKPIKERDFCDPISYYAATKLTATHLCKIFAEQYKKPIITFRLFSVFGPFEEQTRFIPTIMKALIQKDDILLTAGNQRRDFIYVDDVLDAYMNALYLGKNLQGEICNIGTGNEYTNDEVVQQLFTITKKQTKINKGAYPKRIWDTSHWVADITHAKQVLDWKPRISLDKGLEKTYSWFLEKQHSYT